LFGVLQRRVVNEFNLKNIYEFQRGLMKLKNKLEAAKKNLNDIEAFDVILSTPKSGKFIELCFKAGASFYQVRTQ
jgi:hypothetical protein